MNKIDVIKKIKKEKIISIIRSEKQEEIEKIIEAIVEGGINLIEITMTVPNALNIIEKTAKKYESTGVTIGAGTVLDAETAKLVIDAGAKFILSPILNKEVIEICNQNNVLSIPGIATPTEAYMAMKYGAEILKLFPSNVYGPEFMKTIKGPFPNIQILPAGGVSLGNVEKWMENGAVAVGVGGEIMKCAKKGDYLEITDIARAFVEKVNK